MYGMEAGLQDKIQKRVNRIVGQIAGVQRMIEEDRYCVDILNQISAIRSALDALGVELLTSHVRTCVIGGHHQHAKAKPMKPAELLEELNHVFSRFLR
jgi:CsoR family transcriptional regulator, copper-sensing transcriptional repressor